MDWIRYWEIEFLNHTSRGGSRTASTSKTKHFVIIVNGWKPLTIITKSSILDVAPVTRISTVWTVQIEIYFKGKIVIYFHATCYMRTRFY